MLIFNNDLVVPYLTIFFGYSDPGSGMLIWQLVTAGAFGLMFYAKTILRKLGVISRVDQKENANNEQTNSN